MITPKDDAQSILSAIDRFVACLGEDKATVANCIEQYIHLEADAVSRFNILTLRARLPVDAVGIIVTHHKPSTWIPSKTCAKDTVKDGDLDDTSTILHQPVLQPAAASSEDSQSLHKVQQQSPVEADPLDWDPFESDQPPHPDHSASHNLSSSSDDSFVHQTPDQTSSAIEERFKHYESLDYNNLPAYIDVPSPNINNSGQYTATTSDQELTKEAEGLMCSLFDVPQDNDTALPKLCPRSSWNSISRHSVSQVDQQDSGVGVLIHCLYALAATSIPKEVDWLLWRRVLAAYKSARDSPLAAGDSSTHLTPPRDVLVQLRREHADSLGTRSGVRVPVPADSIIRRALLDDANWLSVSSDEAPALDEALAELRAKLTSVPDKLKAKRHLARQTMYDINTLVAVLLGQAAEQPGPASNHLKNCQKDMDKIKSLIPLMRGGKMAKEKMQAALETAEGATRLAAARKAEEDNNRKRSIQGLKAMQDEIQKIERELTPAGEEDSDENQNDNKIDHNDLPGEDDEDDDAGLNDSADKNSDDDDEQPSHDGDLTDDEEPSDGEE
ncbi:hypothetical protein K4K59_012313 [Colletotrichum sp. SAR11_240]|nr:hypothetical protein K4K59_012313 [Colletotrichum sp. SAR11_240]